MELIKVKAIGGIKCDNKNCNYRDDTVDPKDYPNWLNKPCPICGSNLLTTEDYEAFLKIERTVDKINHFYNKLPKFIKNFLEKKEIDSSDKEADFRFSFSGNGKPTICKVNEKEV